MTPEETVKRLLDGDYFESIWQHFDHVDGYDKEGLTEMLEGAIRQAIRGEREACAKLCDNLVGKIFTPWHMDDVLLHVAHAIRNRK